MIRKILKWTGISIVALVAVSENSTVTSM